MEVVPDYENVMARLVRAIPVFLSRNIAKTWMTRIKRVMTKT
jgi:hypothetical protein